MATDDWVDLYHNAEEEGEEWVLLAGDEGSVSAVLFGRAAATFDRAASAPAPSLAFLAPAAAVASASRGRVLFRAAWSQYYVSDLAARDCHAVPRHRRPRSHASLLDAALVSDPRHSALYSVVCAFDDGFEIYSSATGGWLQLPNPSAAGVVSGSSAAFDGSAYWKMAPSPGVLALDLASGTTRHVRAPPGAGAHWQLGTAAGQLCSAVATRDAIELYGLGAGHDWKLLRTLSVTAMEGSEVAEWRFEVLHSDGKRKLLDSHHHSIGWKGAEEVRPRPLRFESDGLEVVLRIGERIVSVDLANGMVREARLEGAVLPERDEDIVPWCRAVSAIHLRF